MSYYTIQPSSRLASLVRDFWVFEGEGKTDDVYIYRSMADGCAELVFYYQGKSDEILVGGKTRRSPLSVLHGQSQKFRRFITKEKFGIFGVSLYPFAVQQLFSLSAADVSNQMPAIEDVLGRAGKELEERMMLAPDNLQRLKIISLFLEKKTDARPEKSSRIIHAVKRIIHAKEPFNVEKLARDYALSTRQFERKFKEFTGFGPKLFARIARFQSALDTFDNQNKSLIDTAYACGYYDQSHFINDFKEFSGYSPKNYFFGYAEGNEHREP